MFCRSAFQDGFNPWILSTDGQITVNFADVTGRVSAFLTDCNEGQHFQTGLSATCVSSFVASATLTLLVIPTEPLMVFCRDFVVAEACKVFSAILLFFLNA